jgi:membrane-associated phospholipid phosphatase
MSFPPAYDVEVASYLGRFLGRHPLFDLCVQSGIGHNVLGGLWYAATLFYFWVKAAGNRGSATRTKILVIFVGILVAIGLAVAAGALLSWAPPSRLLLGRTFPDYLAANLNSNSFPSYSTAVYTALALGVFYLNPLAGALLLIGIPGVIALPRMYIGGHYLTDVLGGCVLGAIGFIAARTLLERSIIRRLEPVFDRGGWSRVAGEILVFIAIWQLAVEFNEVIWLKRSIPVLLR